MGFQPGNERTLGKVMTTIYTTTLESLEYVLSLQPGIIHQKAPL